MHEATTTPASLLYRCHEMMKKREYGDKGWEVELTSFTPPCFQPLEVWVERKLFYERLASLLASKQGWGYGKIIFLGHS